MQNITKTAMVLIPVATLVLVYMVYQKTCDVKSDTEKGSETDGKK